MLHTVASETASSVILFSLTYDETEQLWETLQPAGNVFVGDDAAEVPEGVERTTARATVAAMIAHVVGRFDELAGERGREIAFLDGDAPLGEAV